MIVVPAETLLSKTFAVAMTACEEITTAPSSAPQATGRPAIVAVPTETPFEVRIIMKCAIVSLPRRITEPSCAP